MKTKSLTTRISLVVTALTILVLLATILTVYFYSRNSLEKQAIEETQYKLDQMVQSLSTVQASVESAATYSIPALLGNMTDTSAVMDILMDIVKKNPYVCSAALAYAPNFFPGVSYCMPIAVNKGGVFSYYSNQNDNGEYVCNEWYMVPAIKGTSFWTDPYSNDVDVPVVSYAMPVQNKEDRCEGVLTLSIELSSFVDMLVYKRDENKVGDDEERNNYTLLDRNTTYLTTPNTEYIMNETLFTMAEELGESTYSHIGNEIIAGRNGHENIVINGKLSVVTWRILPNLQWTAIVITPYTEVYASLKQLTLTTVIVSLLAVVLAVLVLIYSVRRSLQPLKKLHEVTKLVEKGKYDAQLPDQLTNRTDEIGELGREFLLMEDAVQNTVSQLEKERQVVKENNEMLTNLIHNVVRNLQMPINNMISFTDGLTMLVDNSDDAQVIKGEADKAGKIILQQFRQLNEMANLMSSNAEHSDSMIAVNSDEFIAETKKSACQLLEERFFLTLKEGEHDERHITIYTNPHQLERLIYLLIVEVSKVSHTSVVDFSSTLNEDGTALRILITSDTHTPIDASERADFFTHFAKQKISAEAGSDYLQLYICYRTAQQLGAKLYVDTGYSAGNRFILECPKMVH